MFLSPKNQSIKIRAQTDDHRPGSLLTTCPTPPPQHVHSEDAPATETPAAALDRGPTTRCRQAPPPATRGTAASGRGLREPEV